MKNGTNSKCNDELNIGLCNYDGGACCLEKIDDSNCEICLCHEDLTRHPSMFGTETPAPYEDDIPIPYFDRGRYTYTSSNKYMNYSSFWQGGPELV